MACQVAPLFRYCVRMLSRRKGKEGAVKKVRYVIGAGAVGLAPTLGILALAGNAAAAVASPGKTGKTVSLEQRGTPNITCGASHTGQGGSKGYTMTTHWSGVSCIHEVEAVLGHSQVGLEMRTRTYVEPGGTRNFSNY